MNKRKGFTLVELVVVIAVIAILAGVLIGTFAHVLKKANKSSDIQRVKSEELAMKADDILKKIEDSNWYGWADFENSIVEKIAAKYSENSTNYLSADDIKNAVKDALVEYGVKTGNDYSTLTEDQVKAIVENAFGTLKYEGVTEEQVKAIVGAAVQTISAQQLQLAQVRAIINAAEANNLTSTQVANIVAMALATTEGDLEEKIDEAVRSLKNSINGIDTLTEEEVIDIITRLVPVTRVATTKSDEVNTGFEYFVDILNSGSTIKIGDDILASDLVLNLGETYKTLCIRADTPFLGTLTINAPNGDIYLVGDFSQATIIVIAVADSSLHINGKVGHLSINKGRAVVESGSSVNTLVAIPSLNDTVTVNIEENAVVDKLYTQYQDHNLQDYNNSQMDALDYIRVYNNGTVGYSAITASSSLKDDASQGTTTNVEIINGPGASGTEISNIVIPTTNPEQDQLNDDIAGYIFPVAQANASIGVSNTEDESSTYNVEEAATDTGAVFVEVDDKTVRVEFNSTVTVMSLAEFRNKVNAGSLDGCHATLLKNVNMSDITSWTPIGTSTHPFNGTFDGDGYAIKKWTTVAPLFGYVIGTDNTRLTGLKSDVLDNDYNLIEENISEDKYTTVIKNFSIEKSNMTISTYMGGIISTALDCYISNLEINTSTILIVSGWRTGILIGEVHKAHINNLHLSANNDITCVDNPAYLGNFGLIIGTIWEDGSKEDTDSDYNPNLLLQYRTIINGCVNDASVVLNKTYDAGFIGGVLGCVNSYIENEVVINCVNNGNITINNLAQKLSFGGICGAKMNGNYLNFINCVNNGDITLIGNASFSNQYGYDQISGICSYCAGPYVNCVNKGNLTGNVKYIAGICGFVINNGATLQHSGCSNTGYISSTNEESIIGDLFGYVHTASIVATQDAINTTNASLVKFTSDGSGNLVVPSSVVRIERNGTFGFTSLDLTNVNRTLELVVSDATITLLGNNTNASLSLKGDNNTIIIGENTVLNDIKLDGVGNKLTNEGAIDHLAIYDSSAESVNNGSMGSVEFIGDSIDMTFTNNGTIGTTDKTWHTIQTQSPVNLTFNNNGTILGYAKKYALLFYGFSNVVFNAGEDSQIIVEKANYTAVFYNVDSVRANSVTFNVEVGTAGVEGSSYYGIATHTTGETHVIVNVVTGFDIQLTWQQKMLWPESQQVGGSYNNLYGSSPDSNHCTSNEISCTTKRQYTLKVSDEYNDSTNPIKFGIVFYNLSSGEITEILGNDIPNIYFGNQLNAGETWTFSPSSEESDHFYITAFYTQGLSYCENDPDVYSQYITLISEKILNN